MARTISYINGRKHNETIWDCTPEEALRFEMESMAGLLDLEEAWRDHATFGEDFATTAYDPSERILVQVI